MGYDEVVRGLAAVQFGVVARRQLTAAGLDHRAIARRTASGMLEPVSPRVLRLVGVADSPAQRLTIAHLDVGSEAFISHTTAAAWWGISGFRLDRIHVSVERVFHWTQDPYPYQVHHSTVVPEWCRKSHRGVPVVSPGLAIYQLAGTISRDRVARALDNAWSLRLLDGRTIDALIERLARPGRNGTVVMRKLRKARPGDWTPPASNLESRFLELAEANGFRFRLQVDIGDEEWSGRVDCLAEDCPLVVEIQSERYHTSLTDRASDASRRERHESMGFVVVEVWDHEIFHTPWIVVERIRAARYDLLSRRKPAV